MKENKGNKSRGRQSRVFAETFYNKRFFKDDNLYISVQNKRHAELDTVTPLDRPCHEIKDKILAFSKGYYCNKLGVRQEL